MITNKTSLFDNYQSREIFELSRSLKEAGENVTINQKGLIQSSKRVIIKKILEAMANGIDVSSLFGEVVKVASTKDLVLKKLSYIYISTQAEKNSDLAILAINTFQKDLQDDNFLVRGLALRTLCSLRILDYLPYMMDSITSSLSDINPYVRKTAAMSCIKLFRFSPKHLLDTQLLDQLYYNILNDKDIEVAGNSLIALNEILILGNKKSGINGELKINKSLIYYLLKRIDEFNEWHQTFIINNIITKYNPVNEDEIFNILNLLDDKLKHNNCGLRLATMNLFLNLTKDLNDIHEDVYKRLKDQLVSIFLLSTNSEIIYSTLEHLILLINLSNAKNFKNLLLENDYKHFYIRIKESSFIIMKKLEIFELIANEKNAKDIIDEIISYITISNDLMVKRMLETIGNIIEKKFKSTLLKLFNSINNFFKKPISFNTTTSSSYTSSTTHKVISKSKLLISYLNILTTIGLDLDESPYILEYIIDNFSNYNNNNSNNNINNINGLNKELKLKLIDFNVKLFLVRPNECKNNLIKFNEFSIPIVNQQILQNSTIQDVESILEDNLFVIIASGVSGNNGDIWKLFFYGIEVICV
ncbi:9005_t:CDS:2 [Entrophospora sp. SA101]|nr:9005_t:CDS:2 [Entrophospora sp. SA101]